MRLFLSLGLFLVVGAHAAEIPSLNLIPVVAGLKRPVDFADNGSGDAFIVEQAGCIQKIVDGRAELFLDITGRVESKGECGLLGLVFHPDYSRNGRFFVNYTTKGKLQTVVSEFNAPAGAHRVDPSTEREILRFDQPWANHNGGQLAFGPDRMLYIGIGDGGSGGDPKNSAQNLATWLGKILRIDVDTKAPYAIPRDNPFVNTPGALPEIWAYGLRNPWRFSFDRQTGQLYCGDVGQNKFEEIDLIEKAKNYGWRVREGKHPYKEEQPNGEVVDPIKDYGRDLGVSVTGGFVYRGKEIPALEGIYLYADYGTGRIWGLIWDGKRLTFDAELLKTDLNISSFGQDSQGELYVCDHGRGRLLRLAP